MSPSIGGDHRGVLSRRVAFRVTSRTFGASVPGPHECSVRGAKQEFGVAAAALAPSSGEVQASRCIRPEYAEGRPQAADPVSASSMLPCVPEMSRDPGNGWRRRCWRLFHPALLQVPYAATATATLICLGLASSRGGSRTVNTPALYSALTLPASTVGGSTNDRANEPYLRSMRWKCPSATYVSSFFSPRSSPATCTGRGDTRPSISRNRDGDTPAESATTGKLW